MNFRRLGNTSLEVSEICLGCMSYGDSDWRPWTLGEDTADGIADGSITTGVG